MGFETHDPRKVHSGDAIVLDNSVAMRWLVASNNAEQQRFAMRVRDQIRDKDWRILVPYLWTYEAAHVVSRYVKMGELSQRLASQTLLAFTDAFSIVIGRESPAALAEFAHAHDLSAYDAAYVMLARVEATSLATVDARMREVAIHLGVSVVQ